MRQNVMLPCVILAGGLGTRMKPATETCPKALIPVLGKPFIDHQLALLARNGIRDVVLCIGYLGEMIESEVGDGSRWGIRVRYVSEGKNLKGTAGAIRGALSLLPEAFFVIYGDSYLPIDYAAVARRFAECGQPALMTVLKNDGQWDKSNARFDGKNVTLYQKGLEGTSYIDYGLSVVTRMLIEERVPQNAVRDLAGIFHDLSLEGRLAGYEIAKRFYEIGSKSGLEDLENFLKNEGASHL